MPLVRMKMPNVVKPSLKNSPEAETDLFRDEAQDSKKTLGENIERNSSSSNGARSNSLTSLISTPISCGSINFYHEIASSHYPLNEKSPSRSTYQEIGASQSDTSDAQWSPWPTSVIGINSGGTSRESPGRFRYVVAGMVVLAVMLNTYANTSLNMVFVGMVSNDVLQSELTVLRARHMSNDPLTIGKDAALPGTCPIEVRQDVRPMGTQLNSILGAHYNASQISALEHLALQQDAAALYKDIDRRVINGELVDWSIQQRGYVLSASAFGAIAATVPVGRLGLAYGNKKIIFISNLVAALRTLLLPTIATQTPFWLTIGIEFIGGMGAHIGILCLPIVANWLPSEEVNFFITINSLSVVVGQALGNLVSSQLLAAGLSWWWCFYLPGILLLIQTTAWLYWGSDQAESSCFVSRTELEMIKNNSLARRDRGARSNRKLDTQAFKQEDETIPLNPLSCLCKCSTEELRAECPATKLKRKPNWTVILTCPTIWALIGVGFANQWTFKYTFLYPTFFSNIQHIESGAIGVALSLKGVWAIVFGLIFAILTRKLATNRPFNMSLTAFRRWSQVISVVVYSCTIALLVSADCNFLACLIAVYIQVVPGSINTISQDVMPLDLSVEDSSLLASVIRLVSFGDIVALPVASYILSFAQDALAGDRATWRLVWLLGMCLRIGSCLLFVLVAKSEPKQYSRSKPQGPCNSLTYVKPEAKKHIIDYY